jgi:two-component system, sensor histidine kinase and response regulator
MESASRSSTPSHKQLRVLMIEDNPMDAQLCRHELTKAGFEPTVDVVETAFTFSERLASSSYDVILADYTLPGWSGMEALVQMQQLKYDIPFILVTGALGDEVAVKCVQAGVNDYILKDRLGRLPVAIARILEEKKLRLARLSAEQALFCQTIELENARERRLQMKEQFLSHVSHELRTPLAASYLYLTNTLDGYAGQLNGEQQQWLQVAVSNLEELKRMVDELLDGTSTGLAVRPFAPDSMSLAISIDQACEKLRQSEIAKNIHLVAQVPGPLPPVYADPQDVAQILATLLENAAKATRKNGEITVRGEVFGLDSRFARVSVSDVGSGMSAEEVKTVFERMYQVSNPDRPSRQGLGTHLDLCERLVARQTGRIWVDSQLNRGSTFSFTLPLVQGRETSTAS